ncbi:hypothetical protein Lal_00018198 [Lupinus albus]|uniref:Uncharacterized protein n=1 Tax=Lupinus albus TaxID=3870 RepID=A0A6A4MW65_LUPAL|nr:hypothetical protein Lalb_Chr25g0287021 [Lupinus albus]KAF1866813.1 hypothetical protein Lal_00018198 [Lupinus albus]
MAGLQQYNFFPTDLFYPKPQPSSNPTIVLPLHNPNIEDKNQHQQQSLPRSMVKAITLSTSIVYTHKGQQSLSRVDNKVSKFST